MTDTLGLRLALAFLGVALAAIALLAVLVAVFSSADVSSLAGKQRDELAGAISVAAGAAWERNSSWASADLTPILDLAAHSGVQLQLRDEAGHPVAATPGHAAGTEPRSTAPVVVHGQRVGTALASLTGSGLGAADDVLRTALLRAIAGTAGLAALLALLAGLAVARRITRPVARLITVTRAMASGDRAARAGEIRAPGELRELAAAFDQMADTLDYEDKIRRDLVASVAHELRTPIAVLQAGHEALLDGVAEPTPAELGSLRDEVLRLARMVNDLQTLAAADAAALHLTRQPSDLAEIAAAAADSLARGFEAAEVTLDRELSSAPVLADQRWMHQVVTNLLGNALKFTPPGGSVTIRTGQVGPDAMLEVADTGVGIPADELPRIFDRFWRGRSAASTSGSGIGLTIAAELAQAHGGTLTASSEQGAGTRLTLALPRRLPFVGLARSDAAGGAGVGQADHRCGTTVVGLRRRHSAVNGPGTDPGGCDPAERGAEQNARQPDVGGAVPGQLGVPAGDEPGVEERAHTARGQRHGHRGTDGDGEHGERNDPERDPWPVGAAGRHRDSGRRRHRAVAREQPSRSRPRPAARMLLPWFPGHISTLPRVPAQWQVRK
jgi:signal transduction histidine kinase